MDPARQYLVWSECDVNLHDFHVTRCTEPNWVPGKSVAMVAGLSAFRSWKKASPNIIPGADYEVLGYIYACVCYFGYNLIQFRPQALLF